MSVWLAIPSKRTPEEVAPVLDEWKMRGYKIAIWRDINDSGVVCDYQFGSTTYPGYASAINQMIAGTLGILAKEPDAEWFICAGDDTLPDPNHHAEDIALECSKYFAELHAGPDAAPGVALSLASVKAALNGLNAATFGVMQPTGDRWGEGQGGFANAPIDRVAGSPWIGREFARRMYGGAGPYWHEYRHMFVDEELQIIAQKMGAFWQRPDLTHMHNHWGRPRKGERVAPSERMPAFLAEANSAEHWRKYKAIFEARKAAGFPGHEPIP